MNRTECVPTLILLDRFHEQHAVQAELPLDRFWALNADPEVPMQAEESTDQTCLCNGLWLHKLQETALPERVSYQQALLNIRMRTSTKLYDLLLIDCCRYGRAMN